MSVRPAPSWTSAAPSWPAKDVARVATSAPSAAWDAAERGDAPRPGAAPGKPVDAPVNAACSAGGAASRRWTTTGPASWSPDQGKRPKRTGQLELGPGRGGPTPAPRISVQLGLLTSTRLTNDALALLHAILSGSCGPPTVDNCRYDPSCRSPPAGSWRTSPAAISSSWWRPTRSGTSRSVVFH